MKINISSQVDLKLYTYAQYNGTGTKKFNKGAVSYELKTKGYFAYREGTKKDYFVFPGLLNTEFAISTELTDKLFEKSDKPDIKRAELNKIFKAAPVVAEEPDLEPEYEPKIKLADKYKKIETPASTPRSPTSPTHPTEAPEHAGPATAKPKNTEEHEAFLLFKHIYKPQMFDKAYETDPAKLVYLTYQWHKLNDLKFSGKLVLPKIRFLKQLSVDKFRRAGHWRGGSYRELAFNRRLFLQAEFIVLMTLLHEMCHQYVDEVLHSKDRSEGGHGHEWQETMRNVGLVPSRYNRHGDYLLTDEEQEQRNARKELIQDARTQQGKHVLTSPASGKAAQYFDPKSQVWKHGVLIKKIAKRWAMKLDDMGTGYMQIPTEWLMEMDMKPSDSVYAAAAKIKDLLDKQAEYKQYISRLKKSGTRFTEYKF